MRKRVIIATIIILAAAMVALGFFYRNERADYQSDPYTAISKKAAIVVETSDVQSFINSLTSGSGLIGEIGSISGLSPFWGKLDFLAGQLNRPENSGLITDNKVLFSFRTFTDDKVETLVSIGVNQRNSTRDLREYMNNSLFPGIVEREMDDKDILVLPYDPDGVTDSLYLAINSGLFICSSSPQLLREAFLQANVGEDVRSMPGFSKVLKASGSNADKVFIVYENIPPLIKGIFKDEYKHIADKVGFLAGSTGFDIFLDYNSFVVSGYSESEDPLEKLYGFQSEAATEFRTYNILPATTGFFETFVPDVLSTRVADDISEPALRLASVLQDHIGGEITKAYIDIKENSVEENKLVIYKLKDRAFAEKLFLDEFDLSGGERLSFRPDDQVEMPVYLTSFRGFGEAMLPGFMWDMDDSYFTFYEDYLITGSSYNTISKILYDNILNKTLVNDQTYREFEGTLPSVSGYFLYIVPARAIDFFVGFLDDESIEFVETNRNSIDKINTFGYQLASSNEMIYTSLSLQYKEEGIYESDTEWETLLDTVAAIKPFFFTNHNTGAKEIFIQDLKNNIYLINAAGRVLWKVPMREKINGSVYMIDIYNNNKYQLLFAGREYLHIIDRNGNYVDRFPVQLRSPSTNSLALFDYDNNNNYRLLIAGEDKQVYAYDKSGNLVRGWNLFKTASVVSSEVSWLRVSGKDYLVVSDQNSIYFLDRTGNRRLSLEDAVSRSSGSALRLINGSAPSVACMSKEGELQQIFFDGSVKKYDLGNFSPDHSFDMFDISGDGISEYMVIDSGRLYLYDHNRNIIFNKEFSSKNLEGPINFIFSSTNRQIGVYDPAEKLIFLVDSNGSVMEGFPLRGASLFSIGHLADRDNWSLIVGGTDSFLYNYKIETP